MNTSLRSFSMSACALAVSVLLAACGGGTAEPPPETVPPTLTITDSEPGDTATGPVTFTFTFSEDVGSSFIAEDVLVTGGTAGTLVKVSATVYTMEVTPTPGVAGTMTVSVAAGKFADLALNENTETASAAQAYGSGIVSDALISWDEAEGSSPVSGIGAYGDAAPTVEAAPSGGSGNALRIARTGEQTFGGTYFTITPALPFTAENKSITARVYATRAGAVIKLKVEVPGDSAIEVAATEAVAEANTWQTLTWNFPGVDPAKAYTVIAISPDVDVAIGGAQSYWIDDIEVVETADVGGGTLTFSSGFSDGNLTAEGGGFGGFSGSNLDGFNCSGDPASCGSGGTFSGDAASGFYYYYQTPTPATDLYMGVYVLAPGVTGFNDSGDTAGVQVSDQTSLKFTLGQNAEWFGSATNNFMIVVDLGKLYTVGGNPCRLQLRNVTTPTAAAPTAYSIPWTDFELVQNCGQTLTVAQALAAAPVSQVSFQGVGGGIALSAGGKTSGANLSVEVGGVYPTTLVINGPITIE